MSRAARVLVLGSINVDLVVRSARLPRPGETVIGGDFFQAAGGKGANQAVAAARAAGGGVALIAAVGDDDFGRWSRTELGREPLGLDHVRTLRGTATGVALILVDASGENLISVASGANQALGIEQVAEIDDAVWSAASVFLAGLEVPLDVVRAGLERARRHGLLTVLNPAPALTGAADPSLLGLVDLLTPNEHEAATLAGIEVRDPTSAAEAGHRLRALGCRQVLVTLGGAGSVLVGAETVHIPARPVVAIDTTAAGDALNGALVAALAEGRPLREAIEWATVAAAISVTRRGAQPSLPQRAEIDHAWSSGGPPPRPAAP